MWTIMLIDALFITDSLNKVWDSHWDTTEQWKSANYSEDNKALKQNVEYHQQNTYGIILCIYNFKLLKLIHGV